MGYMELSIVGSDMAADATFAMTNAIVKSLKKSLKEKGNVYNTSGPVNVAMIFDEIITKSNYFKDCPDENLIKLATETRDALVKIYENSNKWMPESTEDKDNKKYHITIYKHLLKVLNKFIKNK